MSQHESRDAAAVRVAADDAVRSRHAALKGLAAGSFTASAALRSGPADAAGTPNWVAEADVLSVGSGIASPAGAAYSASVGTIGPAMTFGSLVGAAAADEAVRA